MMILDNNLQTILSGHCAIFSNTPFKGVIRQQVEVLVWPLLRCVLMPFLGSGGYNEFISWVDGEPRSIRGRRRGMACHLQRVFRHPVGVMLSFIKFVNMAVSAEVPWIVEGSNCLGGSAIE